MLSRAPNTPPSAQRLTRAREDEAECRAALEEAELDTTTTIKETFEAQAVEMMQKYDDTRNRWLLAVFPAFVSLSFPPLPSSFLSISLAILLYCVIVFRQVEAFDIFRSVLTRLADIGDKQSVPLSTMRDELNHLNEEVEIKQKKRGQRVIGVSLEKLLKREGKTSGIPDIIRGAFREIALNRASQEGLFRINPKVLMFNDLKRRVQTNEAIVWESEDTNCITNFLKLFLRSLPEPLFLFENYDELVAIPSYYFSLIFFLFFFSFLLFFSIYQMFIFSFFFFFFLLSSSPILSFLLYTAMTKCITFTVSIPAGRALSEDAKAQLIRDVVCRLPPPQRCCLEHLVGMAEHILEHQSTNLMTENNLAVCFAPNVWHVYTFAPKRFFLSLYGCMDGYG